MRANLDLVLDWAHTAGLGELALEQTHTLSSAVNLLATPRKNLLQVKSNRTHLISFGVMVASFCVRNTCMEKWNINLVLRRDNDTDICPDLLLPSGASDQEDNVMCGVLKTDQVC